MRPLAGHPLESTQPLPSKTERGALDDDATAMALVLIWSRDEPERVGELVVPPLGAPRVRFTVGRALDPEAGLLPLSFVRLRPHESEETGPLRSVHVSRRQFAMRTSDTDSLNVERLARAEMRVNGQKVEQSRVRCGDIVEIDQRFMMMCTKRPVSWPQRKFESAPRFAFGAADPDGIVGESPSAWALRAHIASVARGDTHVLVHGPSGSGKELAAQAVHRRSRRRASELVARNAATFPEGLIDAELFGNMKNFPNPGMREREGLFGAANNSTLFLDEIGELPQALQAHLLRALDRGEYQRLGESRARKANVRLLGATNRELNSLRSDFLARFTQRIELVGLNDRRDDIPLLAQHISRALAAEDPSIAQRFFDGERARMSARLIYSLVSHDYSTNARELKELLWRASADSVGAALDWTGVITPKVDSSVDPATLTREQVIAALERCGGVRERAWRVLGLRSRHQLKRLLQKFNI